MKVRKFVNKPIVIEAVPCWEILWSAGSAWNDLPRWVIEAYDKGEIIFTDSAMHINTRGQKSIARSSDWVIRGLEGGIYPCHPETFHKTYEEIRPVAPYPLSQEECNMLDGLEGLDEDDLG